MVEVLQKEVVFPQEKKQTSFVGKLGVVGLLALLMTGAAYAYPLLVPSQEEIQRREVLQNAKEPLNTLSDSIEQTKAILDEVAKLQQTAVQSDSVEVVKVCTKQAEVLLASLGKAPTPLDAPLPTPKKEAEKAPVPVHVGSHVSSDGLLKVAGDLGKKLAAMQ